MIAAAILMTLSLMSAIPAGVWAIGYTDADDCYPADTDECPYEEYV